MITCTCSFKVELNDYGMEELFLSQKSDEACRESQRLWGESTVKYFLTKNLLHKGMEMSKFLQEIQAFDTFLACPVNHRSVPILTKFGQWNDLIISQLNLIFNSFPHIPTQESFVKLAN